jgi:hypothetical protein
VGWRLASGPLAQASPAQLALAPVLPLVSAVQWTGHTPLARLHPRAVPNPRARLAAWTRRTGGHGRRLTGRSEPLHRDGIASRIAPDRVLTPAPAPALPTRLSFPNAATLLAIVRPPAIAAASELACAALPSPEALQASARASPRRGRKGRNRHGGAVGARRSPRPCRPPCSAPPLFPRTASPRSLFPRGPCARRVSPAHDRRRPLAISDRRTAALPRSRAPAWPPSFPPSASVDRF